MNQVTTEAAILSRIEYSEADRIVVFITPEHGKVHAIAKGVRRERSRLAGGIELFSISTITYLVGRSDLVTLTTTKLKKYYSNIVKHMDRTMLGYELIKRLNRATEDNAERSFFELTAALFEALDDADIKTDIVEMWFNLWLINLSGNTPNLETDTKGEKLKAGETYQFNFEDMAFFHAPNGHFTSDHIKLLRLVLKHDAKFISQIKGARKLAANLLPLSRSMVKYNLHI